MVMNKKGFLKIMEAVIAIIVLLTFLIAITPTNKVTRASIPPDLEETTNSILKEMQGNPEFRSCVLSDAANPVSVDIDSDGDEESLYGAECVYSYTTDFLAKPYSAHPWNYSIRLCDIDENTQIVSCDYEPDVADELSEVQEDVNKAEEDFTRNILPVGKDIYTRGVTLTVPDISGEDILAGEHNRLLTIYAWSKS